MKRILVIGRSFPHASHSYTNNDVDYLAARADVLVLSLNQPKAPFYSAVNCNYFNNEHDLLRQARHFQPDFIIAWMLPNHFFARTVAEALGVPFLLRLHTPDPHTIPARQGGMKKLLASLKPKRGEVQLSKGYRVSRESLQRTGQSDHLRGAFCIPALKDAFAEHLPTAKIFELKPRIFYDRFHNEQPNGDKVLLLGALVNRRQDDTTFGRVVSSIASPVDWYPIPTSGCLWLDIPGRPDNIVFKKYQPPAAMPAVYKQYKAMVMVGSGPYSRGLSLSILEAQAAGVTVLAPSLRPDFDAFVTQGGGFVFHDESEIMSILQTVPHEARRALGFRHAAAFDMAGVEQEFLQAGLVLQSALQPGALR